MPACCDLAQLLSWYQNTCTLQQHCLKIRAAVWGTCQPCVASHLWQLTQIGLKPYRIQIWPLGQYGQRCDVWLVTTFCSVYRHVVKVVITVLHKQKIINKSKQLYSNTVRCILLHPYCQPCTPVRCRSWYVLAFQAPWLPEILFAGNDYKTIDSMFRLPPTGAHRAGAISAEEVERQGSLHCL